MQSLDLTNHLQSGLATSQFLGEAMLKSLGWSGGAEPSLWDLFSSGSGLDMRESQNREQVRGWNHSSLVVKAYQFTLADVAVYAPREIVEELIDDSDYDFKPASKTSGLEAFSIPGNWVKVPRQHRVERLMRHPNPWCDEAVFRFSLGLQFELDGHAHVLVLPNQDDLPAELYVIPNGLIAPQGPTTRNPGGSYRIGNLSRYHRGFFGDSERQAESFQERLSQLSNREYPARYVIEVRLPGMLYADDHLDPTQAMIDALDTDREIDRSRRQTLRNQHSQGPVFKERPGVTLTQPERDAIVEEYRADQMGPENAGEPRFNPRGVDVDQPGYSAREMEFSESKGQSRDEILGQRLVPPSMLGLGQMSSFASVVANARLWARNHLQPVMRIAAGQLTNGLRRFFDEPSNEFAIVLQVASIEDQQTRLQERQLTLSSGTRTKKEWREEDNLEPFGDERDDEIAGQAASPAGPASDIGGGSEPDKPGLGAAVADDTKGGDTASAFGNLSRQQWSRNHKAVMDVLHAVAAGKMKRGTAVAMLGTLGLSQEKAEQFVDSIEEERKSGNDAEFVAKRWGDVFCKAVGIDDSGEYASLDAIFQKSDKSGCGANATGGGGFQPGNTCAGGVKATTRSDTIGGHRLPDGSVVPDIQFQPVSAEEFLTAVGKSKRQSFLTKHTKETLKEILIRGGQLFVSPDKATGFILTGEKDLQNVFNNGGPKGAGKAAVIAAIQNGAKTLDCFDGFLPEYYAGFGFQAHEAWKWNDEYAPEGWPYDKAGRPDVILMHYNGDTRDAGEIVQRYGTHDRYVHPAAVAGYNIDIRRGAETLRSRPVEQGRAGAAGGTGGVPGQHVVDPAETSALLSRIRRSGGFTYQPVARLSPTSGYAVSMHPESERSFGEQDIEPAAIATFLADNWDKFESDGSLHFGAWHNLKSTENPNGDNRLYLDMSRIVADRLDAESQAKRLGQLGIYDLVSRDTIETMTPEERRAWEDGRTITKSYDRATGNDAGWNSRSGDRGITGGYRTRSNAGRTGPTGRGDRTGPEPTVWFVKKSDCGANASGGGGFQPGNDCAGGGKSTASEDKKPGKQSASASEEHKRVLKTHRSDIQKIAIDLFRETTGQSDGAAWTKIVESLPKGDAAPAFQVAMKIHKSMLQQHGEQEWKRYSTEGTKGGAKSIDTISKMIDHTEGVDAERAKRYTDGLTSVLGKMPSRHVDAVRDRLKRLQTFPDTQSLKEFVNKEYGTRSDIGPNTVIAGMFATTKDSDQIADLLLDGDELMRHQTSEKAAKTYEQIVSHELGHVIDRHFGRISATKEWERAWKHEAVTKDADRQISSYAMTKPMEGFAEYNRLFHQDPRTAITKYPRMWSIYKKTVYGDD